MTWRARTRVNLGGGGKEGTRTIKDRLTSINLNIGTESRVQIADALGKELHHPKMSKLWDLETGPTDRQIINYLLFLRQNSKNRG